MKLSESLHESCSVFAEVDREVKTPSEMIFKGLERTGHGSYHKQGPLLRLVWRCVGDIYKILSLFSILKQRS